MSQLRSGVSVVTMAAAAALLLASPSPSLGGLIPFAYQPGGPLIFGDNGTLSYDAGARQFQATTTPETYTSAALASAIGDPNGFGFFNNGSLSLDLSVDNNGNLLAGGGGFTLTGSADLDGDGTDDVATSTLLSGTVLAFGAEAAGPPTRSFNGLFTVLGGTLTLPTTASVTLSGNGNTYTPEFYAGEVLGFTLSAEDATTGILGNFTQSFSSDSVKSVTGATVPEPGALTLALTGALTLAGFEALRRRRAAPRA